MSAAGWEEHTQVEKDVFNAWNGMIDAAAVNGDFDAIVGMVDISEQVVRYMINLIENHSKELQLKSDCNNNVFDHCNNQQPPPRLSTSQNNKPSFSSSSRFNLNASIFVPASTHIAQPATSVEPPIRQVTSKVPYQHCKTPPLTSSRPSSSQQRTDSAISSWRSISAATTMTISLPDATVAAEMTDVEEHTPSNKDKQIRSRSFFRPRSPGFRNGVLRIQHDRRQALKRQQASSPSVKSHQ